MGEAQALRARLARLVAAIEDDRAALARRAAEVADGLARGGEGADAKDRAYLALSVHHYYSASEHAFEAIARTLDGGLPESGRWHRDLLDQMTVEIDGVRPAILPGDLRLDMERLLGFRHFLRSAYAVDLDWAKLRARAEDVGRVHPRLDASLAALAAFARDSAASLEGQDSP